MKETIRLSGVDWSWESFQKAMSNANRAQHFIPLKMMTPKQKESLVSSIPNEQPPTGPEIDNYPEIRADVSDAPKGPIAKKRGRPKKNK